MKATIQLILCSLISCLYSQVAYGSHLFGADLRYNHISGMTYSVILDLYGDCSGSAFPSLASSVAEVLVINNGNTVDTMRLHLTGPGVEVTPVCPSEINNTNCRGGTVPGITRFTFADTIILSGFSANWLFRFTGALGTNQAGRSNSITNINIGLQGGSIMVLEARLNNSAGQNSTVAYTTIPTPFFCISKPASYNPGAIDANGDSLVFSLVPGLDPAGSGGFVSYVAPYTAGLPLDVLPGNYSFSATTGQLNFEPAIAQKSLVVSQVEEYRNGVLVGTSMREMTFVVLSTCNNNPPIDTISNVSGAATVSNTIIGLCVDSGPFSFNIDPTDQDGDTISVTTSGIPAGAACTIGMNNTPSPTINFSWNSNGIAPGSYTFFATYIDNGCPLASKQTVAYTVAIRPRPDFSLSITDVSCHGSSDAQITVSTAGPTQLYQYAIDGSPFQAANNFANLASGTHTVAVRDTFGCGRDTVAVVTQPDQLIFAALNVTNPTCEGFKDGSVSIQPSGGMSPYMYAIDSVNYVVSNAFPGLKDGQYTFYVKDSHGCILDTTVILTEYPHIVIDSFKVTPATCFGVEDGNVNVFASGGNPPLTYSRGNDGFSSSNFFDRLGGQFYRFSVKDITGCIKDSTVSVPAPQVLSIQPSVTGNDCIGDDNGGAIKVEASGGTEPYIYRWATDPAQQSDVISGLANGVYPVTAEDSKGCKDTLSVTVGYDDCCTVFVPGAFTPNGDGKNDKVSVLVKGDMRIQHFSIFNRFGQRVFYSVNANDRWDGRFNGEMQDIGTYYYYLSVICGNKGIKTKDFKGDIVLIR